MTSLRKSNVRDTEQQIETGPLNDILFILLMFFLFISTLANPNTIRLATPKASSDTKIKQSVVVSLNKDGKYFIGTKPVAKDSLLGQLRAYLPTIGDTVKPSIIINTDSNASIANMVYIMRIAKELKASASLGVTGGN